MFGPPRKSRPSCLIENAFLNDRTDGGTSPGKVSRYSENLPHGASAD